MKKAWIGIITLLAVGLGGVSVAAAQEAASEPFELQFAAGFKGGVNGVAGHGFDNNSRITGTDGNVYEFSRPEYYGHFGVGGTGGLSLEARALGFVGLEFGFFYSQDNADGYVDKNDARTGQTLTRITSEQRTTAYHIPILLKLNVPADVIRPFLGVGFEFVRQIDSSLEYDQEPGLGRATDGEMNALRNRNQIEATNYTLFAFTAGIEIAAGPVKIPFEVRGGYTLGFDRDADSRARYDTDTNQIIYDGVYMGHFGIFTGVLYEFDLLL